MAIDACYMEICDNGVYLLLINAMLDKQTYPKSNALQKCDSVVRILAGLYHELKPDATKDIFMREVMLMVRSLDSASITDPIEIIMQFLSPELRLKGRDWVATQSFGPIMVSAAYCSRALTNHSGGFEDQSWSNATDAMFWCGVALARTRSDEAIYLAAMDGEAQGVTKAMAETARSGAQARSDAWQPIREFALQYARRPNARWSSRAHAAKAVAEAALTFCKEQDALANVEEECIKTEKLKARLEGRLYHGKSSVTRLPKIKPKSFERTVDLWLKQMPDAAALFPAKQNSK